MTPPFAAALFSRYAGVNKEGNTMTNAQVSGNLMYAAALQQLTRLAAAKNMTDQEIERIKKDLERRLRPTIIALC